MYIIIMPIKRRFCTSDYNLIIQDEITSLYYLARILDFTAVHWTLVSAHTYCMCHAHLHLLCYCFTVVFASS